MADKIVETADLNKQDSTVLHDAHATEFNKNLAPELPGKVIASSEGRYRNFSAGMCSAEPLLDRWVLVSTYNWTTADTQGNNIFSLVLPDDFVSKNQNSPSSMMFRTNKYWRGNVNVKVTINSNKFMVGLLQLSYYYCHDLEDSFKDTRDSVWLRSQMPCEYISAGVSNSVEMTVPFAYPKAYMSTIEDSREQSVLSLFQLRGKVLGRLKSTSDKFTVARVSVFVNFDGCEFVGLKDISITKGVVESAEPEMFPLAAKLAEVALREILPDDNRDLPHNVKSGMLMIPRLHSSMAVGKNEVPNVNPLRLDAIGQTPKANNNLDLSVINIASKPGLVTSKTWKYEHKQGELLINLPVTPLFEQSQYKQIKALDATSSKLATFAIPPIGVVASMFTFWRGEICYDLRIVCSSFHTGRLQLSFIPYMHKTPTVELTKNSYVAVFDLQEDNHVIFRCPYINDNPWSPVYNSETVVQKATFPIGQFNIHVLNPLIPMDNIPANVEIFVSMYAGDTFQVAIPNNPVLGLGIDRDYLKMSNEYMIPKPGYTSIYAGNWRYLDGSGKYIMRYGEVTDHVAQVINGRLGVMYRVVQTPTTSNPNPSDSNPTNYISLTYSKRKSDNTYEDVNLNCIYFVVPLIPNDSPRYIAPVESKYYGRLYLDGFNTNYLIDFRKTSTKIVETASWIYEPVYVADTHNTVDLSPGGMTTRYDPMISFGESFEDLKDYLRRYQPYASERLPIPSDYHRGSVIHQVPLIPQGLPLNVTASNDFNDIANKYRHGHIPMILSMARYFTGGLRFKILFSCDVPILPVVQHIPSSLLVGTGDIKPISRLSENFLTNSLATVIQSTSMNPMIEIETPFYQPGILGILQRASLKYKTVNKVEERDYRNIDRLFNLGYLNIAFQNEFSKGVTVGIDIYYSVADDFNVYNYMGFPSMSFNIEVPENLPAPKLSTYYPIINPLAEDPLNEVEDESMISDEDGTDIGEEEEQVDAELESVKIRLQSLRSSTHDVSNINHEDSFSDPDWEIIPMASVLTYPELKYVGTADHNMVTAATLLGYGFNATSRGVSNVANAARLYTAASHTANDLDLGPINLSNISETIMSLVSKMFPNISYNVKFSVLHLVSQIGHMVINNSRQTLIWSLLSIFVGLGLVTFDFIEVGSSFFSKLLSRFTHPDDPPQYQSSLSQVFDEGELNTFISALVSTVLTSLGMACTYPGGKFTNILAWLLKGVTGGLLTMKTLLIIMKNFSGVIMKIIRWAKGQESPHLYWDEVMACSPEELNLWARKVIFLTDPLNKLIIEQNIYHQKTVHECYIFAQVLSARLMTATTQNSNVHMVRDFCQRIISLHNSLCEKNLSPPVKFEPFVMQLTGNTGVGKSHVQTRLSVEMLQEVNYKSYSEPIYVKTPGNAFWNTLGNQPVFLIDDFMFASSENLQEEHITALFCLKSRAIFNPPMAELHNKDKRYSPLIVQLAANASYWSTCVAATPSALHRRRDLLYHALRKPEYEGKSFSEMGPDVCDNYKHLYFIKLDPNNSENEINISTKYDELTSDQQAACISFDELLIEVKSVWKAYYFTELENVKKFLKLSTALYPDISDAPLSEVGELYRESLIRNMRNHLETRLQDTLQWKEKILNLSIPFLEQMFKDATESTANHQDSMSLLRNLDNTTYLANNMEEIDETLNYVLPVDKLVLLQSKIREMYNGGDELRWLSDNHSIQTFLDASSHELHDLLIKNIVRRNMNLLCILHNRYDIMHDDCIIRSCEHSRLSERMYYDPTEDVYTDPLGGRPVKGTLCTESCMLTDPFIRYYLIAFEFQLAKEIHGFTVDVHDKVASCLRAFVYAAEANPTTIVNTPMATSMEDLVRFRIIQATNSVNVNDFWLNLCTETIKVIMFCLKVAFKTLIFSSVIRFSYEGYKKASNVISTGIKNFFNPMDSSMSHQSGSEKDSKEQRSRHQRVRTMGGRYKAWSEGAYHKVTKVNLSDAQHNSFFVNTELKDITMCLNRNAFFLTCDEIPKWEVRGLMIFERVGYLMKHSMEALEALGSAKFLKLHVGGGSRSINSQDFELFAAEDSSLAIIKFSNQIPPFKDIRRHIVLEESMNGIGRDAMVYELFKDRVANRVNVNVTTKNNLLINETEFCSSQKISFAYEYNYGGYGVCGSALVSIGNKPKIIGIHIAGNNQIRGYAEPIWLEKINADLKGLTDIETRLEPNVSNDQSEVSVTAEHNGINVCTVGYVEGKYRREPPKKSRLRPSPMQELFDVVSSPAPLHLPRDFMLEGLKKRNNPPLGFPRKLLNKAKIYLEKHIVGVVKPLRPFDTPLLDTQTAILGYKEDKYYKGVEMSTSEGFPWFYDRPKSAVDKSWLFDVNYEDWSVVVDSELQFCMDEKNKLRRMNIVPDTVFTDCLKDSRLMNRKIDKEGCVRIFSISPVDFTIQYKQYFGHFIASLMASRIDSWISVGINCDSEEWGTLFGKVTQFGDFIITGDYTAFGDNLDPECVYAAFEIINSWYRCHYSEEEGCENQKLRNIMAHEVVQALFLNGVFMYRPFAGIPSGFPGTVEINSLVNLIYILCFFLSLPLPKTDLSYRSFKTNIFPQVYGDDFIMGVSRKIIPYFNGKNFQAFLSGFNIKMHSAFKDGDMEEYHSINQATYLKRRFVPHPERASQYLAPLPYEVVTSIPHWYWETERDIASVMYEMGRATLINAYGLGPDQYKRIQIQLQNFFSKYYEELDDLEWDEIDDRIYNGSTLLQLVRKHLVINQID